MANIVIDNYEPSETSSPFTFVYNPNTFDVQTVPFRQIQNFPYAFTFIGVADILKDVQNLVLSGHTSGDNRDPNFRLIQRHFKEPKLKKLTFGNSKFYIGVGNGAKRTRSGNRTNFVDYVASFMSPVGVLFGTAHTPLLVNSSTTNGGDVFAPITRMSGSVTSGLTVTIRDTAGNGFVVVPSATGVLEYRLLTFVDIGSKNKVLKVGTAFIGSTEQKLRLYDSTKSMILGLESGESLSSIGMTQSAITASYEFYDGWSAE